MVLQACGNSGGGGSAGGGLRRRARSAAAAALRIAGGPARRRGGAQTAFLGLLLQLRERPPQPPPATRGAGACAAPARTPLGGRRAKQRGDLVGGARSASRDSFDEHRQQSERRSTDASSSSAPLAASDGSEGGRPRRPPTRGPPPRCGSLSCCLARFAHNSARIDEPRRAAPVAALQRRTRQLNCTHDDISPRPLARDRHGAPAPAPRAELRAELRGAHAAHLDGRPRGRGGRPRRRGGVAVAPLRPRRAAGAGRRRAARSATLRRRADGIQIHGGYAEPERYAEKKLHKQLRETLCARCRSLAHGEILPAVAEGRLKEAAARASRRPTSCIPTCRADGARRLLADLTDVSATLTPRVRDLVGGNPLLLVGTSSTCCRRAPTPSTAGSRSTRRRGSTSSACGCSRRGRAPVRAAARAIVERGGRDVLVGAANVGKSKFLAALIDELAAGGGRPEKRCRSREHAGHHCA